jgi:hypothetical protein
MVYQKFTNISAGSGGRGGCCFPLFLYLCIFREDPEDAETTCHQCRGILKPDHRALHPRKQHFNFFCKGHPVVF